MSDMTPLSDESARLEQAGLAMASAVAPGSGAVTIDDILPAARPVIAAERISSVDVLRGVAVLGILLMNIVNFGLPEAASMNPTALGGKSPLSLAVYFVNHVIFEGKMRALFSMLFGAGIVLLTSRAEARGAGIETADIYCRRNLWLLLIGMLHAYLLWDGDILYSYALGGLLLFPFRKLSPKMLLIFGVLVLATQAPKASAFRFGIDMARNKAEEAKAIEATGKTLTEEQIEAKNSWQELEKQFSPDSKRIEKELAAHRGGYWTVFGNRAGNVFRAETGMTYKFLIWDVLGMMLIGMGLLKLGVLSAEHSERYYWTMVIAGYSIGIPLGIWDAVGLARAHWSIDAILRSFVSYDVRRLTMVLGHIGLVMLAVKKGLWPAAMNRLGAVGRMALTNYLMTTIICTTLFYGYGLGWYGRLERYQLYGVVLVVWALMLAWSRPWLSHFQFGPFEWLWRSLTYWKLQPLWVKAGATTRASTLG